MMRRVGKVRNVDEPDQDTDNGDDFSESISKVVKFLLERSLFVLLGRDRMVNGSNSRLGTNGCNKSLCSTVNDESPLKRGMEVVRKQESNFEFKIKRLTENSILV